MGNSERHPDYADGSCEDSSPGLWSVNPWIRIRGTIEGVTGIRITIKSEQGVQTHMSGHISPIVETEGVEVNMALKTQTVTGLLQAQESSPSQISASCAISPRVSGGQVDAGQRQSAVVESFHRPSGVDHPPGGGGEGYAIAPKMSHSRDEGEYPEWVLAMFQNMDSADHLEQ